jgi:hypothetical protein
MEQMRQEQILVPLETPNEVEIEGEKLLQLLHDWQVASAAQKDYHIHL